MASTRTAIVVLVALLVLFAADAALAHEAVAFAHRVVQSMNLAGSR